MLYSVGDMLPFAGKKVGGSGVDPSCEPGRSLALDEYNRIVRLILNDRENFVTAFVHLAVQGDCLTLDRSMQRILQAKTGDRQLLVTGQSFKFIDGTDFERCGGCSCLEGMTFLGADFPTHRDLDKPRLIFAVSDRPEDEGTLLTVVGADEDGLELRTVGENGSFQKGIQLPIAQSSCESAPVFNCGDGYHRGLVSKITMLRKPRTRGYVHVWGLNEFDGEVYWITSIAPDELSPSLTRYSVPTASKDRCQSVFAQVSLQFAQAFDDNEIALIQQPDAIQDYAAALAFKDMNDLGGFNAFRNSALKLIKKDLDRKDGPTHRVNVRVNTTPNKGRNFSMRNRW